jgi:invasion protein IalB
LLTEQLMISVDGGAAKKYPFRFCTQQGCFAQIGFTAAELDAFKKGKEASLVIVPRVAPDQQVTLTMSLSGFTSAFDAIPAR